MVNGAGGRRSTIVNRDRRGKKRKPIQTPPQKDDQPHHPWLLFCHGKSYKHQTFCTTSGETYFAIIPELSGKVVMACCDDWLVLMSRNKNKSRYSIWNTQTFESIVLPPLKSDHDFNTSSCLLSSPPDKKNSMVLLFDSDRPIILSFRFGSNLKQWREVRFGKEIGKLGYSACCNGVIYVSPFSRRTLFEVDIDEEPDSNGIALRPLETNLPIPGVYCTPQFETRLVESAGELFTINIFVGGIRRTQVVAIEVFRLILSTKEWVKVDSSCKDRVFFLGDSNSVSCLSRSKVDGGSRIYFTLPNDQKLCYYSFEDRSISVPFCFPNLPLPRSSPTWIAQRHQEKSEEEIDEEREEEPVETKISSESDAEDSKLDNNMLHLPPEILEGVAKRLVLLDYMNFRAVCRQLLSAAPAIQWRKASVLGGAHSLSPWLVFTGKDGEALFNLMEPEHNGRYFTTVPTELRDAIIYYSRDGWLLMSRDQNEVFFFNPFTKVVLSWPKLSLLCIPVASFIFSSLPTSSDCSIIGISVTKGGVSIYVIGSGDEEWTNMDFITGTTFYPAHSSPVAWKGGFYFLSEKGKLGLLHTEEQGGGINVWKWNILGELRVPCKSFDQCFLVECEKELLSIFIGYFGEWVRVFRLDLPSLVWKEVHSLGGQTVFVSRSSAFSVVEKSKEMGNRIYFSRLYRENLVFYSLETRRFHSTVAGEDSLMDYAGTKEPLMCNWIEPRWV